MSSIYVKEFFAETQESALAMAATHYRVSQDKLEVRQISDTIQIEGLGTRSCFLICVAGMADAQPEPAPRREGRSDRGGRGRDRDRDRDRDRGRGRGRDRGRDRGGRGGGDRRGSDRRRHKSDRPEGVDHERLEGLAREAADRVLETGEPVTLEPMGSKERWVIHNYVKDVEGLTSVSEGEGREKRVRVVLE